MQGLATLTRGHRVNGVMALAIGIALLAALILGGVALNTRTDLPMIGGADSAAQPAVNRLAEMTFVEQNVWNLERTAPTTRAAIHFSEDNSFDYTVPTSEARIKFVEENAWDYESRGQFANEPQVSGSAPDYQFIEENAWGDAGQLPSGDFGQLDY